MNSPNRIAEGSNTDSPSTPVRPPTVPPNGLIPPAPPLRSSRRGRRDASDPGSIEALRESFERYDRLIAQRAQAERARAAPRRRLTPFTRRAARYETTPNTELATDRIVSIDEDFDDHHFGDDGIVALDDNNVSRDYDDNIREIPVSLLQEFLPINRPSTQMDMIRAFRQAEQRIRYSDERTATRRLDRMLRLVTVTGQGEGNCAICLVDYEEGDVIAFLGCGHGFHDGCVRPWLSNHRHTCPFCRAAVREIL